MKHFQSFRRNGFSKFKRVGLEPLPSGVGYDVCGEPGKELSLFLVSHRHLDHLPAREKVLLLCAEPLVEEVRLWYELYGLMVGIEPYYDYIATEHSYFGRISGATRLRRTRAYAYFYKSVFFIPEADNFHELLLEYGGSVKSIVLYRQPYAHLVNRYIDAWSMRDCYFADPRRRLKYAFNVLPKSSPSLHDIGCKAYGTVESEGSNSTIRLRSVSP